MILLVCLYISSLIMMTGIHPIFIAAPGARAAARNSGKKYYNYRHRRRATDRGTPRPGAERAWSASARKLEKELHKKGLATPTPQPGCLKLEEEDDGESVAARAEGHRHLDFHAEETGRQNEKGKARRFGAAAFRQLRASQCRSPGAGRRPRPRRSRPGGAFENPGDGD